MNGPGDISAWGSEPGRGVAHSIGWTVRMHNDSDQSDLPDSLKGDLQRAYARTPQVPPTIDAAILNAARGRMRRFRPARTLLIWGGGAVTAAAAVLAVALYLRQSGTPPAVGTSARDVNRDGKVDMLDAYVLARRVDANVPANGALDLNSDGKVDRLDADVIARDAVRLPVGAASAAHRPQGDKP